MRFIKEYNHFIREEVSKNEPIPEIIGVERGLAIFVIGQPAIGKSYFIKNHIHSKNPNINDFSTDDVSLLFTKDPNIYYKGKEKEDGKRSKNASELNLVKMKKFIETGQNFIYDTTGAGKEFTDRGFEHVKEIYDLSRNFGYKIIFIHLLSTLQTSLEQDKLRSRHVDPHYIQWAYAKQQGGEVDGKKVEGNIQRYKKLNPDAYYLVTSIDRKYKFYKFIGGKLAVRKNDKYLLKENIDIRKLIDDIVETMLDFTDDDYKVSFGSNYGEISFTEYLEGNIDNFKPTYRIKNKIISYFSITISSNNKYKTYEDFVKICDDMQIPLARIIDMDWNFKGFKVKSYDRGDNKPDFSYIEYEFNKPDQIVKDEPEFNLNKFGDKFEKLTELQIENIEEMNDGNITVYFSSKEYDGELPRDIEERLDKVAAFWGCDDWQLNRRNYSVDYYWDN